MDSVVMRSSWDDALVVTTNHTLALSSALSHPKLSQRYAQRMLEIMHAARGSLLHARAAQLVRVVASTLLPQSLAGLLKSKTAPPQALLLAILEAAEDMAAASPEVLLSRTTEARKPFSGRKQ